MRLAMTCPECFSREIAMEGASARWDEARQAWMPGQPESYLCDACGKEFDDPRRIEITEQKEAA